jgi:hypothetical protein
MNTALSIRPTSIEAQDPPRLRLALTRDPEPYWAPVVIRLATADDRRALERLAQLDSTRAPAGETVIGKLQGKLVAAVSMIDGKTISDPFVAGSEIAELVRLRAQQLGLGSRNHRPIRPRNSVLTATPSEP